MPKEPQFRSRKERLASQKDQSQKPSVNERQAEAPPEEKKSRPWRVRLILIGVTLLILILAGMIVKAVFFPQLDLTTKIEQTSSTQEETGQEEAQDADSEPEPESGESQEQVQEVAPESSDAIRAYRGDWEPIGTQQTGDHVTNYEGGSQDRQEIAQAVGQVTGLNPASMIEHWIGNDGSNQGVYATVSSPDQSEMYRVHLRWVDQAGWQPILVEVLQES